MLGAKDRLVIAKPLLRWREELLSAGLIELPVTVAWVLRRLNATSVTAILLTP
jgi:hypothetical protein